MSNNWITGPRLFGAAAIGTALAAYLSADVRTFLWDLVPNAPVPADPLHPDVVTAADAVIDERFVDEPTTFEAFDAAGQKEYLEKLIADNKAMLEKIDALQAQYDKIVVDGQNEAEVLEKFKAQLQSKEDDILKIINSSERFLESGEKIDSQAILDLYNKSVEAQNVGLLGGRYLTDGADDIAQNIKNLRMF